MVSSLIIKGINVQKKSCFFLFLIFSSFLVNASDSTSIKVVPTYNFYNSIGYNQHSSILLVAAGGMQFFISNKKKTKLECIAIYDWQKIKTKYRGFNNLEYSSHQMGIGLYFYPIKRFYLGASLGVTLNTIIKSSKQDYTNFKKDTLKSPQYFTGFRPLYTVGYRLPVFKFFEINLFAHLGQNQYQIGQGSIYFSNTELSPMDKLYGTEEHNDWLYSINLGLVWKFSKNN